MEIDNIDSGLFSLNMGGVLECKKEGAGVVKGGGVCEKGMY